MKKIINPGKVQIGKKRYNVFCEIEFDKGHLSICGVIGPRASGNCAGGCGQIVDELKNICSVNSDWTSEMISKLAEIWKEWHLNNLTAGSPKQEAFVKEWLKTNKYDYDAVCVALSEAGLYEDASYIYNDAPYKYGHAWLTREVPANVIDWLFNLPNTKETPAWV